MSNLGSSVRTTPDEQLSSFQDEGGSKENTNKRVSEKDSRNHRSIGRGLMQNSREDFIRCHEYRDSNSISRESSEGDLKISNKQHLNNDIQEELLADVGAAFDGNDDEGMFNDPAEATFAEPIRMVSNHKESRTSL